MAKVLVTGGAGFIGSHIVDALIERGYGAISLDKLPCGCPNRFAIYERADIANGRKVSAIFKRHKPDYVIHCAARARIQPSLVNPVGTYRANVTGTLNILEACRKSKIKKMVYSGSSSVYAGYNHDALPLAETLKPLPLNPYAYSKLMAEMLIEQYVKNYELKACSLRYFNVYGPRQPIEGQYGTVIGIFLRQLQNSEPLTIVPDGHQRRDFTWIGDIVNANILAMESNGACKGEIINIGSGKNFSILEAAEMIGGKDYPIVFTETRVGEAKETLADISKAKMLLDWEPKTSFEEGIKILKKETK